MMIVSSSDNRDPAADRDRLIERAHQHPLFRGLDDDDWAELTKHLLRGRYQPAQVIFEEGDASHDLHLILSGTVELRRQYVRFPGDYLLASLYPGKVFGEMSLMGGRRRTSTAIALTEVETALLSPTQLGMMSLPLQIKLHRTWTAMISDRVYWLDTMFTDWLEQGGSEQAAVTMALLHARYQP